MDPQLGRGNITCAVCVRNDNAGRILMWRDENRQYYPMKPSFHLFRLASLSGTARVLESLYTKPLPNTLMDYALRRNVDAFAKVDEDNLYRLIPRLFSTLNTSQKKAVATLCSSSFKRGFFLVQGPPG